MAPQRPILDDLELRHVREIETGGERVRARHQVPALEGDFLQDLGRRGGRIDLSGVLTGPDSGEGLAQLREKFRGAEPVPFVSDIATATRVEDVLIEDLAVRELAGRPARFAYSLSLREFTEPPATATEDPPEIEEPEIPDDEIDRQVGALVVEVLAEGDPGFDFGRVVVGLQGTGTDGAQVSRNFSEPAGNVWTDENVPAGDFTVQAMTAEAPVRAATALATVRPGETTQVTLKLSPAKAITKAFVIHFRFDSAFVEPCMRPVLKQVADYAKSKKGREKVVIVGHTDKAGSRDYNQSLSERRARAAYAYLTSAARHEGFENSVAEWNALRLKRPPGELPSLKDSWGTNQYQYMLQDLGFYAGNIDGKHGDLTDEGVEAFRCQKGLPPGTQVDDAVWDALIRDYLAKEPLAVEKESFLPNCQDEILKWLGCGEEDPLKNTDHGHRPSRRTEFLFVDGDELPCKLPEPVTFELPEEEENPVASDWCLGPGDPKKRCCFLVPFLRKDGDEEEHKGKLNRPAPPAKILVEGKITLTDKTDGADKKETPFAGKKFVLIAPDGTFKQSELYNGEPVPATTGSKGEFSFSELPVGVYTLEVREKVIAHLDQPDSAMNGNVVCKELTKAGDRLDVAVEATQLRQIRLPVVAHLMSARDSAGERYATGLDATGVGEAFAVVNRIWKQARIRFELKDVVRHGYFFEPPPSQPFRHWVEDAEFDFLLRRCSYPKVVNVFFIRFAGNSSERGFAEPFEEGDTVAGCGVEERSPDQMGGAIAHALGHVLSLRHPEEQSGAAGPFGDRLMSELTPAVTAGGTELIDSEEEAARASRATDFECQPLALAVESGATQVGGSQSPMFVALRQSTGPVVVEARLSPELLALGTLSLTGGEPVPGFPLRRTVSRLATGRTTVEAVFTLPDPAQPAEPPKVFRDRVHVSVVDLEMEVDGALRLGGQGSNIFVAEQDSIDVVTIEAKVTPDSALPPCLPADFVRWTGCEPLASNPLRCEVSKREAREVEVTATFAGIPRRFVIRIFDLAFVEDRSPFDREIGRVKWGDGFRVMADLPGEGRDEITVEIISHWGHR